MQKGPKLEPVICGIDIGSWTVKIGCYDGSKFDILTNEANFRETPALVAFTPSERMIGESANTKVHLK
jgi:molecular chaperone DnaK (HSP70)